jgi:hypothetical protein
LDDTSSKKLTNDIESRLDTLFEEDNAAAHHTANPLEKLKTVVLSIDWEITDNCLSDLIAETDSLIPRYQHDDLVHALLRMLQALGRYIRKRKAQSHPDAIKRIMSIFSGLEKLVTNQETDLEQKKRILAREIAAFKKLKQQVDSQRTTMEKPSITSSTPQAISTDPGRIEKAVDEIEKRLSLEVQKLKEKMAELQREMETLRRR